MDCSLIISRNMAGGYLGCFNGQPENLAATSYEDCITSSSTREVDFNPFEI